MNQNLGLIGKKLGCTQIFNEDGSVVGVTVIETGPCVVLGKRSLDKHGYTALVLGFGEKRKKLVRKAEAGLYEKLGLAKSPRVVREFRVPAEVVDKYEVGQTINAADVFAAGTKVDVSANSKGRGFTGVMKRHNFAGAGTDTHGTHEYRRHGGSIGTNMTPGRTLPNLKMPGRYGGKKTTILSLEVAKVMPEEGLVLIAGGVPGPKNGIVTLKAAVKTKRREA
jgi:large subunit ribosomal protein L3